MDDSFLVFLGLEDSSGARKIGWNWVAASGAIMLSGRFLALSSRRGAQFTQCATIVCEINRHKLPCFISNETRTGIIQFWKSFTGEIRNFAKIFHLLNQTWLLLALSSAWYIIRNNNAHNVFPSLPSFLSFGSLQEES